MEDYRKVLEQQAKVGEQGFSAQVAPFAYGMYLWNGFLRVLDNLGDAEIRRANIRKE